MKKPFSFKPWNQYLPFVYKAYSISVCRGENVWKVKYYRLRNNKKKTIMMCVLDSLYLCIHLLERVLTGEKIQVNVKYERVSLLYNC